MHARTVGAVAGACLLALGGCGTLPDASGWGEHATLRPGWQRVRTAAVNAARDSWVWVPLAGAAALQIDEFDVRTSDWAREHTPVFGSQKSAGHWSDDLRSASAYAHYVSILATPSGSEWREWLPNKLKGAAVQAAAVSATSTLNSTIKRSVDRERPDGQGSESFPSGHASSCAVHTRLASRNIALIDMRAGTRRALDVGLYALTIGTSWARIEAGRHHAADTLAGMALGNFMGSFINDTFLGSRGTATLKVNVADSSAVIQWNIHF